MGTENSSTGAGASAGTARELNAFIFDLDGVIWRGNAPIEGAVEAVAQLKAAGKRCLFCTNNSRQTPEEFAARLREVGIEAGDEDVMTSAMATVLYMESQFTGPFTAYVIGEEGLVTALRRTGAIITISPIIPQRSDLNVSHGAMDCVIVGIDATFSYHKMRLAQRLILSGARFIATNRDSTFPTPHGVVPGAGAIVAAIETATGISPIVLGKPQPLMLQLLAQKFALNIEEIALVGDRLDTDMTAAHRAGAQGLFVATGVHTIAQARRAKGEQKPDGIYEDLPTLCEAVLGKAAKVADVVAAAAAFGVAPVANGAIANSATANGAASNGATADGLSSFNERTTQMETVEAAPVAAAAMDETEVEPVTADDVQTTPGNDVPDAVFDWSADSTAPETETVPQDAAPQHATPISSFALQNDDQDNETPAPPEVTPDVEAAAPLAAFGFSMPESATAETAGTVTTETAAPLARAATAAAPAPSDEPEAEAEEAEAENQKAATTGGSLSTN